MGGGRWSLAGVSGTPHRLMRLASRNLAATQELAWNVRLVHGPVVMSPREMRKRTILFGEIIVAVFGNLRVVMSLSRGPPKLQRVPHGTRVGCGRAKQAAKLQTVPHGALLQPCHSLTKKTAHVSLFMFVTAHTHSRSFTSENEFQYRILINP
jgi:hypothetical protein